MSTNHNSVKVNEVFGCPHSHKAPLVLENGELAGNFLSRHFESCETCNRKLSKLKNDRKVFLKQIPFISSTEEVKSIFQSEAALSAEKIKKRVSLIKRKKAGVFGKKMLLLLSDLRATIFSRTVVISVFCVALVWSYLKFFN